MRCPHCGAENYRTEGKCARCSKPLNAPVWPPRPGSRPIGHSPNAQGQLSYVNRSSGLEIGAEDVANRMRLDYLHATRDSNQRTVEAVTKLMATLRDPSLDLHSLLEEIAKMVNQQFRIRTVALGLRGPDKSYRYTVGAGFREDAWAARAKIVYGIDDFLTDKSYKGTAISDYTKIYLEEDKPYANGEEATYNRPVLLKSKRLTLDQSLEGDYADIHIYGHNKELIGWLEISGTLAGKMPDTSTIRWLELISAMLSVAIMMRGPRTQTKATNA